MSLCLSSFSSGVRRLDVRTGYTTTKVMERMLAEFTETILLLLVLLQSQSQGGKTQNERTELMRGRPSTIHAIETSTTISPPLQSGSIKLPMFDGLHSSGKPVPLLRLLLLLAIIIIIIMRTSTSQFAQAHLMESRLLLRSSLCSGICRHGHAENLRGRAGLKYKLGSWNNRQMRK